MSLVSLLSLVVSLVFLVSVVSLVFIVSVVSLLSLVFFFCVAVSHVDRHLSFRRRRRRCIRDRSVPRRATTRRSV